MTETHTHWYFLGGTAAAIVSLIALPIAAFVSLGCSYRVHRDVEPLYGYLLAGLSVLSIFLWSNRLLLP